VVGLFGEFASLAGLSDTDVDFMIEYKTGDPE
jgi:hypothetical protein